MKISLESTDKIVEIIVNGVTVPARIWQGETESGIPVHCYVTRIVPEIRKSDPRIDELTAEFERELQRCANPRTTLQEIPLRMIL
jgi:hypothetical protein